MHIHHIERDQPGQNGHPEDDISIKFNCQQDHTKKGRALRAPGHRIDLTDVTMLTLVCNQSLSSLGNSLALTGSQPLKRSF